MILTSTSDLKKYIAIAASFDFEDFAPYIEKAVNTYTRKYVGALHTALENESTGTNAIIENQAREYLRSALANFAWFLYIPLASVQMDSAGISVVQNDNKKSAEWWQIKDIRRELLRSGHESMDLLLAILEANPTIFADYATNYSSINNELLVPSASVFSKYYNIFDSRQTYLALQPIIRLVQDQYISTMLCPELIESLKVDVTGNIKAVKLAIQKAIVSLTIAKVSNNGLFILDDRGMRVDFENFSDGRRESASYGKSVDQLKMLADEQIANGSQYLKIAKELILNNLSDFTMCTSPILGLEDTTSGYKSFDSKGVFGI
ncbi:hypothetical protein LXD69_10180 [Flavobacterium sediminilitoris]|uniref:Uncharacterized protein n=1 Tax=Flavobacterium sediminilitoris TaxID=2024526 RepID=A0ABY4HKN6_9FLAO|nr:MULTISPECIES: DUF6712 family protein [Flavobacterium]UOX32419.1 hypothetical protein LXD69_10180 [Flavobacterium sediminilitoris]